MLVLSRKVNERVCIGDGITITVLRIKGNAVRIGFEAPDDLRIRRGEHVDAEVESVNGGEQDGLPSDTTNTPHGA